MDEALEVLDLATDLGLGDAFAWILRVFGLLFVLAGVGVWLFTDLTVLVPLGLVVLGLVLLVAPSVLLFFVELA